MRGAIWLAITTRRLCCLCLVLPLEVSILQQTVLSLNVYVLQKPVLSLDMSVHSSLVLSLDASILQQTGLSLNVYVLQQPVLSLPGHACTHQPCAASRNVYAAADCAVSERLCSTAI